MWPFRSTPAALPATDHLEEARAAVQAFGPVGMEFNYLGRRCVVIGHSDLQWPPVRVVPVVKFDYVDDVGVIRTRVAYPRELPALIAQRDATNV